MIERSVDGGEWTQQGTTRRKQWTDAKAPMGAKRISYRIYGQRGDRRSTNPAQAVVNFGNQLAAGAAVRSLAA